MSRGYLILAQNNRKDDYLRMAYALGLSIKNSQSKYSSIALATDTPPSKLTDKQYDLFDHIVDIPWTDHASSSKWKIENKWKYYYMSPFDETIVLDADMLFPSDISYWWDILSSKEMWIANKPKTFRNETITSTKYRQTFVSNNLPNVYTAFMYFKKTRLTAEVFKMTELIFENWERFYYEFLDETRPQYLSGDVAYALAIKILGYENECLGDLNEIPTFVHMKSFLQNVKEELITEDWTKHFPTYFSNDGTFKIGNYQQYFPFHYQVKNWLTDEMIDILEKRIHL
jgi:hypothetical protein